jgi:hypothetical protein
LANVKIFPENESYAKTQEYSRFLTSFRVRMISYTKRADQFLIVKFVGKPELLAETFRLFFLPAEFPIDVLDKSAVLAQQDLDRSEEVGE